MACGGRCAPEGLRKIRNLLFSDPTECGSKAADGERRNLACFRVIEVLYAKVMQKKQY